MPPNEVHILADGHFQLDLGLLVFCKVSYYGQKYWAPLQPLLVITPEERVLVDTGIGEVPEKVKRYYPVKRDGGEGLVQSLRRHGLAPEDITLVINTHLHLDHAGNNRLFRNARFVAGEAELAFARNPPRFAKGGYMKEVFEVPGGYATVSGEAEVVPGIRVVPTPGHTAGHMSVVVECAGKRYIYTGDASPLKENLTDMNVTGILHSPVQALESLQRLAALGGENTIYIFSHDAYTAGG